MAQLSGTIKLSVDVIDTIPPSASVLSQYQIRANPSDTITNYGDGTAAGQGHKFAVVKQTATAAVVDTDLSAVVCSDGTAGFTHVREIVVFNDSTTSPLTLGLGTNPVTSLFMGGTTPTITVQPGAPFRVSVPLGTTGLVISGTAKVLRLDPGGATIAFRIFIVGD